MSSEVFVSGHGRVEGPERVEHGASRAQDCAGPGLVISPISTRSTREQALRSLSAPIERAHARLIVSPGTVQVSVPRKGFSRSLPAKPVDLRARARESVRLDVVVAELLFAPSPYPDQASFDAAIEVEYARLFAEDERLQQRKVKSVRSRSKIVKWSRKSRARMCKRLAELDYSPLFVGGASAPVMLTLTLPGDFRTCTPDGDVFKRQVSRFRERWFRKWGTRLVGVWKLEFQRRGAPHLHILTTIPVSAGRGFAQWFSRAWMESVNHPDESERAKHLIAGTGIDWSYVRYASNPALVAAYFTKHGMFWAKAYQNRVPEGWENVGRFWGYWGLKPACAETAIDKATSTYLARMCRKMAERKGRRFGTRASGSAGYIITSEVEKTLEYARRGIAILNTRGGVPSTRQRVEMVENGDYRRVFSPIDCRLIDSFRKESGKYEAAYWVGKLWISK
ncbi:hypothetical protein [Trueperella sp. LYQ141]|uniref:rolling circle replication-associated protein n=1 Tax=Trueperella sp. LYQ141 TaxID=3391058 RepID=UPI0039830944